MRHDIFIIWGSGIPHFTPILNILRSKFMIIMIRRHEIKDMAQFIDDVYACDSYPISHLKSKTRYLLKTAQECYLILVKNNHVREKMVGEGAFRKPQCMYVQGVKIDIRAQFNPVQDEHVIHGTDYESQVHELLSVFNLEPLHRYRKQPHPDISYPWSVTPFENYKKVVVSIDQLRIGLTDGSMVHVSETPHYKYVCGDKGPYKSYWELNRGRILMEDHSPEAFDQMIGKEEYDRIIINQQYFVIDGGHRCAVLKFRGLVTIKCILIC